MLRERSPQEPGDDECNAHATSHAATEMPGGFSGMLRERSPQEPGDDPVTTRAPCTSGPPSVVKRARRTVGWSP